MRFELAWMTKAVAEHPMPLPAEIDTILAPAADAWQRLASEGCRIHFSLADADRMVVELRDADGFLLSELSAIEAVEIACAGV